MASPAVIGGIGIGTSLIGSLFSAQAGYKSDLATAKMYDYQAAVAGYNAAIERNNEQYAMQTGMEKAQVSGMKTRAEVGQTIARQGASGIAVNSGSAPDVVASERYIGQQDVKTIMNNAARIAYGYKEQAAAEDLQQTAYKSAAADTRAGAPLRAASTLMSGATSVASKWFQASQSGMYSTAKGSSDYYSSDPTYSNYGYGHS